MKNKFKYLFNTNTSVLDGWVLNDKNILTNVDTNDTISVNDVKDLYKALKDHQESNTAIIELEFNTEKISLTDKNLFKFLGKTYNYPITVSNKGIVIGSIKISCDDIPDHVYVSNRDNKLLVLLSEYIYSFLDD